MKAPIVGYAGLTHLGLCSAVGTATKGFRAIGFSPDASLVASIAAVRPPIVEPGLDEALLTHKARLTFTAEPERLAACDIVFIAIDVPTDANGTSNLAVIDAMLQSIAPHLKADATLAILSQVPPGFTRRTRFAAERLYYQVETLIFGRALERATAPERFIVGCADPAASLPAAYSAYLGAFGCPILPMRYESAELAKIAINCFLVASVSTTNTLAELSECIGADWSEIVPALKLDARIGPSAYLKPGLGIAGGNLERDLATVLNMANRAGTSTEVIATYLRNSSHMKEWAYAKLKRTVLDVVGRPRVGILGLAYKQDTNSTKNSPALALIERLRGVDLTVHDPVVSLGAVANVTVAEAPEDVADGADAIVLMTPWPQYRNLDPTVLADRMRGRIVVDPYGVFNADSMGGAGLEVHSIGKGALLDSVGR